MTDSIVTTLASVWQKDAFVTAINCHNVIPLPKYIYLYMLYNETHKTIVEYVNRTLSFYIWWYSHVILFGARGDYYLTGMVSLNATDIMHCKVINFEGC